MSLTYNNNTNNNTTLHTSNNLIPSRISSAKRKYCLCKVQLSKGKHLVIALLMVIFCSGQLLSLLCIYLF